MEKNKENKEHVLLSDLAVAINLDKSNAYKNIKSGKYGDVKMFFVRNRDKGNQKMCAVSNEDFENIKRIREETGFFGNGVLIQKDKGFFYIIQTNPNNIPNRYKFGFTNDMSNRLRNHRCLCPNLKIIKKYPCNKSLELALLKVVNVNCKRIGQELYEVKDIKQIEKTLSLIFNYLTKSIEEVDK